MCQGEDIMTQHRLIFLKGNAGFALSVKLKMLVGEHPNDIVTHPVHAFDYDSSVLSTPFMLIAARSVLSKVCRGCCPCTDTTPSIDGVVTETLSNSDANLWCCDTYPV